MPEEQKLIRLKHLKLKVYDIWLRTLPTKYTPPKQYLISWEKIRVDMDSDGKDLDLPIRWLDENGKYSHQMVV